MTAVKEKMDTAIPTFRESWDIPVAPPKASADYLRIKGGEKAAVRLLTGPVQFHEHYVDGRSRMCGKKDGLPCAVCDSPDYDRDKDYPKFRFGIALFVHAIQYKDDSKYTAVNEVRLFESSKKTLEALRVATEEVEDRMAVDFTIARENDDMTTRYYVNLRGKTLPVPGDVEVPNVGEFYTKRMAADAGAASVPASNSGGDTADPFTDN